MAGTHGPAELEQRIEAFLQSFAAVLAAMEPEDFERHRSSLIASKLQKDHSLGELGDRHWEQIFNQRCHPGGPPSFAHMSHILCQY